jgi:hypothetical protein
VPTRTLTTRDLNRALLARQQLLKRKRLSVPQTIHNVGGLQTQEPKDPFVSLWSRIDNFKREKLLTAAEDRSIVRGSNLRCTIHTVTAEDFVKYRLALQPVIARDTANWKDRYIGLDKPAVIKAVRKLLSDDVPRNAREIGGALQQQFPDANREGLSHCARIHVPVVMTPTDERFGYSRPPKLMLAERFLGEKLAKDTPLSDFILWGIAAIGPCGAADLRTWSGMPGIREAIEPLRPQLMSFRDESGRELFDLPNAPRPKAGTPAPIRFLGEFDNVALSHADRARIVDPQHAKLFNFSKNGRRAFTVLIDGFVRASWQINVKRKRATITVMPFEQESRQTVDELAAEAERLVQFVEPDADAHFVEFGKSDLHV